MLVFVLEQMIPSKSMLFTVLKKGATYALVAVSMNLLNGFTGLFSLGQAGFMLIGAYTYAIFTIPVGAARCRCTSISTAGWCSSASRCFVAILLAGVFAAAVCVSDRASGAAAEKRLSGDRHPGFAEIIRAIFQWDKLGFITNGSNLLRLFPVFNDFNIKNADGQVVVYFSTLFRF